MTFLPTFEFAIEYLFHGVLGLFFLLGISQFFRRPLTKEEVLQLKNRNLERKVRHMRGHNLHLQGVVESLHSALKRAQKEKEEGQRSEARLRGELARERRRSRSLEFALQLERDKSRDTRRKKS